MNNITQPPTAGAKRTRSKKQKRTMTLQEAKATAETIQRRALSVVHQLDQIGAYCARRLKKASRITPAEAAKEVQARLNLTGCARWPIITSESVVRIGLLSVRNPLITILAPNLTMIPADVARIATEARGYEVAFQAHRLEQ